MNIQSQALKSATDGVAIVDDPSSLSTFLEPGCAAAIWRRRPPRSFQSWLDTLDPETLPKARTILRAQAVPDVIGLLCDEASMPNCANRKWFEADVMALSEVFSDLMSAPYLRLRMDVVTTNACRKFHIDALTARLVCTYRGTGTQYGISNDNIDPEHIFTVPTGAPILLRGTLWPAKPSSGLRHRSPPIEGTGETRLVMVLDPVFDLENEA